MAFDFSEEKINEMYSIYRQSLEKIEELVNSAVSSISQKATELKYEQVVKLSKDAVTYYNENLKQDELHALSSWQDGDLSFVSIMREQKAGDSAITRARTLEDQIEDQIRSMLPIDGSALDGIDTTGWKCNAEEFENISEIFDRFNSQLDSERSQYASRLDIKKEENTIYVSIEPVILETFSIVSNGFNDGIKASFSDLASEFQNRENAVKGKSANTAQNAASKAKSIVSDGASTLRNSVKSIWE